MQDSQYLMKMNHFLDRIESNKSFKMNVRPTNRVSLKPNGGSMQFLAQRLHRQSPYSLARLTDNLKTKRKSKEPEDVLNKYLEIKNTIKVRKQSSQLLSLRPSRSWILNENERDLDGRKDEVKKNTEEFAGIYQIPQENGKSNEMAAKAIFTSKDLSPILRKNKEISNFKKNKIAKDRVKLKIPRTAARKMSKYAIIDDLKPNDSPTFNNTPSFNTSSALNFIKNMPSSQIPKPVFVPIGKNPEVLFKIIKIQAFYRKHLAQQKFSLLKSSKQTLKILAIRLKNSFFHIKITKNPENYLLSSWNGTETHILSLSKSTNLDQIKENLELSSSSSLKLTKSSSRPITTLLKQCQSFINSTPCMVFYNSLSSTELIISTTFQDALYEIIVSTIPEDTESQINHRINDYLSINNKQLFVDYPVQYNTKIILYQTTFYRSASTTCEIKIFRVLSDESDQYELSWKSPKRFSFSLISTDYIHAICLSKQPKLNYMALCLHFRNMKISVKSPLYFSMITEKFPVKIRHFTYEINVFIMSFQENRYLFECADESLEVKPLIVSDKFIEKVFNIERRKIIQHFRVILKRISVTDKCILLNTKPRRKTEFNSLLKASNLIHSITPLQRLFREKRIKMQEKIEDCPNGLLTICSKEIHGQQYQACFYKAESGFLLKLIKSNSKKVWYKACKDYFEYGDNIIQRSDIFKLISKINLLNGKIIITRAVSSSDDTNLYNSIFLETEEQNFLIPSQSWPIFNWTTARNKHYLVQGYPKTPDCFVVDFIPLNPKHRFYSKAFPFNYASRFPQESDVLAFLNSLSISCKCISQVSNSFKSFSISASEDSLNKSLCKIAKQVDNRLWIIYVSLKENSEEFLDSLIYFSCRIDSYLDHCRVISIDVKSACEVSGFNSKIFIPMCQYIAKKMIIVNETEFFIDFNAKGINVIKQAQKIQTAWRAYKTRKVFRLRFFVIFTDVCNISSESFKMIVYFCKDSYFLAAVKGGFIAKLMIAQEEIAALQKCLDKKTFMRVRLLQNLSFVNGQIIKSK